VCAALRANDLAAKASRFRRSQYVPIYALMVEFAAYTGLRDLSWPDWRPLTWNLHRFALLVRNRSAQFASSEPRPKASEPARGGSSVRQSPSAPGVQFRCPGGWPRRWPTTWHMITREPPNRTRRSGLATQVGLHEPVDRRRSGVPPWPWT
jgi:hypothetical protein